MWSIPLSKSPDAHFTVFPERLVELCVWAGCPEGGVVLDPIVGSGTTALVSARLGRSAIGIDIKPRYCEMAAARLAAADQPSSKRSTSAASASSAARASSPTSPQ